MKHIYKNIILITLFVIFISNSVFSQTNTLYWMKHLPQSMNANPAKQSNCKFYLDVYVLPNFSFNAVHTGFTFDDAIKPLQNDSFMVNIPGISDALGKNRNGIDFDFEFSLINLGFTLRNNMFFTFGVNYKVTENFQYPRALLDITNGNYRLNKEALSFDFRENFMAHRELYLGLSKKINDKLTIGAKVKFLNGYVNIDAKKMKVNWYTSVNSDSIYNWTFESDIEMKASLPININYDSLAVGSFEFEEIVFEPEINAEDIMGSIGNVRRSVKELIPHNFGLGIDIGVEYKITNNILLSASVLDLGYIRWKTNPITLTQNATYSFNGFDIFKYANGTQINTDSMISEYVEILENTFAPTIKEEAYTSGLNTKIFVGGNFIVKEWLDFGLLYRGSFMNSSLYSSYTASGNLNFFRGWSYTLSYSVIDRLANNIGMGLAYKIGPYQMYLITDNIAVPFWAVNGGAMADKWIRNTKRVNFAFGMNFTLCKKRGRDIGLFE